MEPATIQVTWDRAASTGRHDSEIRQVMHTQPRGHGPQRFPAGGEWEALEEARRSKKKH
jgi:hypothetical protein